MKGVISIVIILVALVIQFTSGMNYILVPLSLHDAGYGTVFVGVVMASEVLAILVMFKRISDIVNYFGVFKILFFACVFRSAIVLSFSKINYDVLWVVAVFFYGTMTSMLLVVVQTWLNTITGKGKGIFIGLYSSALSCGVALSPVIYFMYREGGGESKYPFEIGAVVALLPILLLFPFYKFRPELENSEKIRVSYIFSNAKKTLIAAFVGGICFFGLPSFLTIYGTQNGLKAEQASLLLTMFMIGSVTLGMLGSVLSDYVERKKVILFCMAISTICAVFLSLVVYADYYAALVLMYFWGGGMGAIYAVGLSIIGETFSMEDQVSGNMSYVLMDAAGGLVGLCCIGVAMELVGVEGLSYTIAFACTVYFIYALVSHSSRGGSYVGDRIIYPVKTSQGRGHILSSTITDDDF